MANGDFIPALLLALVVTLTGAVAKYVYAKNRPAETSFRDHVLVSCFVGMMMFFYGLTNNWSYPATILGCGAGGWYGASVIRRISPPGIGPEEGDDDDKTG